MPDVYAAIATADEAVPERLADMLLDDLALPGGARVLDLGCGTGAAAEPSPSGPKSARWA
jgi:cyclopropane fatty-acyl-phospholipid synthase-like methyltransferase